MVKRRGLSKAEKSRKDCAVFKKVIALPEFIKAELVLVYVSTELEVDTSGLISHCVKEGKAFAVPGIVDEEMRFFTVDSLEEVKEAKSCGNSVCVVPMLGYNEHKHRLGYGGGYYDRFLSGYNGFSAGLCYSGFMCCFHAEEHDFPVDTVIVD